MNSNCAQIWLWLALMMQPPCALQNSLFPQIQWLRLRGNRHIHPPHLQPLFPLTRFRQPRRQFADYLASMHLDELKNRQLIQVQDAELKDGEPLQWSRPRGTRVHISSAYVKPTVEHLTLFIPGSTSFDATSWNDDLKALVSYKHVTRILGVDSGWRSADGLAYPILPLITGILIGGIPGCSKSESLRRLTALA